MCQSKIFTSFCDIFLKRFLFILIVSWLLPLSVSGSFPITRNFLKADYGADTQNWDIDQDDHGRMLFANKRGLLIYDGASWNLQMLPFGAEVRCVEFDSITGRTYVGASGLFGYFSADEVDGRLAFHQLTVPDEGAEPRSIGDVWNIVRIGDVFWFQGDEDLFRYDGGDSVRKIHIGNKITSSGKVRDCLYFATDDGVLKRLSRDNRILDVSGAEILKGKNVVALCEHPFRKNRLLVVTAFSGCYIYDGGSVIDEPTPIDSFLKSSQIFSFECKGDNILIGTVDAGIAICNFRTGQYSCLDRRSGLQNNTVLSSFFDAQGNIWLGLDNGIDFIQFNSPVRRLIPNTYSCGTGYASFVTGNSILLGTNQGLFSLPYPSTDVVEPEQVLKGQVWALSQVGSSIMAATDIGVYYGASRPVNRIAGLQGAWDVQLIPGHDDEALVAGYNDFYIIRRNAAGEWRLDSTVKGFSETHGHFFFDPSGNLWISDWRNGVYRMKLDPELSAMTGVVRFDESHGLPYPANSSVSLIDGSILLSSPAGFFSMTPGGMRFSKALTAEKLFAYYQPAHFYQNPDGSVIMLNDKKFVIARRSADGKVAVDSTTFAPLAAEVVPGFDHISFLKDRMIFSGENGFYELSPSMRVADSRRLPLFVSRIFLGRDSLFANPGATRDFKAPELPYKAASVTFEVSMPEYRCPNGVSYSFMLEGYDKGWSAFSHSPLKEYTRLANGDYVLRVRARNAFDNSISETAYSFRVATPWYLSSVAKIIYVVLSLLLISEGVYAVLRYAGRKARRTEIMKEREIIRLRREAEDEQKRTMNELEILQSRQKESEEVIEVLHHRQLEQEKSHGSESLSVITKSTLQRNEILMQISHRLEKLKVDLSEGVASDNVAVHIEDLLARVNTTLNSNDDYRDITRNFDRVYGDYLNRLTSEFPDLSKSEIKLACYIKMGLSTKEIAPLMNVAPKSAEMSRYRLRKKLRLERSDNLAEFLQNF